ncbi:MAG: 5-formyltetrahydrofolate cyclo-ligase [Pseudorhodobacter sp.]
MDLSREDESSEPCFAHLLVDGHVVDPETRRDVTRFRQAERKRLYAARKKLTPEARKQGEMRISAALDRELPDLRGQVVAAYWPIRGEPDLRGWMAAAVQRGARIALPVVVVRDAPLEFHEWAPGIAMARGIWGIPVPAQAHPVQPQIVIAPLLGVDAERFRLGNGGGYYDRSLVRLSKTHVIGVGHAFSRIKTIFPLPWDVPMHRVVLDDGTIW